MTGLFGSDPRRYLAETVVGLVMIPLSLVPIGLYLGRTDDGYLMYLRGRYQLFPPATPGLSPQALAAARIERRDGLSGVPVLVYHGIGRETDHAEGEGMVVSRTRFAEQMRMLASAGYRPITTKDLARYLATRDERTIPRKPILITFDDGRSDAMIQADRILADTGMRATMFVIADAAESNGFYYESTERLAAHARSGRWELANHTEGLHHQVEAPNGSDMVSALVERSWGETPSDYRARIAADLDRAQAALEPIAGERPLAFAYPFGDWGKQARPGTAAALGSVLRSRFRLAFDQDGQETWRPALPGDDPLHIHRLQVGDWPGRALLARLEAGAERSASVYAERALGYEYSAAELADAARGVRCAAPSAQPVRGRADLGARKLVALTFSDGPSPVTPTILDLLKRERAEATFFVEPAAVDGRQNLLRRAFIEGHELGAAVGMRPVDIFPRQVGAADVGSAVASVESAVGTRPCLVRPTQETDTSSVARLAAGMGLGTILWSVDPADFAESNPTEIARRVVLGASSGSIVVLHDGDGRDATAEALPLILDGLRARGFRLVTVSELLRARAPVERKRPERPRRTSTRSSGAARAVPRRIVAPTRTRSRLQPVSRPTAAPARGAPKSAPPAPKPPASPSPPPAVPEQPAASPPTPAPAEPEPPTAWPGRGNGRDWETPPGKDKDPEPPPEQGKGRGDG